MTNISPSTPRPTLLRQLLMHPGSALGILWIGILAIAAAFAPFLANSRPLYQVVNGVASMPALQAMNVTDWLWLVGFVLALLLLPWPLRAFSRFALWLAGLLITAVIASQWAQPPALTIYDSWRSNTQTHYQIHAPIPWSPKDYLRDFGTTSLEAPLSQSPVRTHWMGTEENGADVAARMIHAARVALAIGFIATGIALFIGTIVGGLMGWFSGLIDIIGMRLVEIFEAIPTLFLLLAFVAFFGRSVYMMMIIIGLTSWSGYARYIRAEFLKLRHQDFVHAAIVSALPLHSVLFRHMLPNAMAPLLVAASFGVASAILAEATLSFLGLGVLDDPSWGQMLNQAVQSSVFHWWLAVFPGGAIFLTVFAYNLIGERLRDAFDPRLPNREKA